MMTELSPTSGTVPAKKRKIDGDNVVVEGGLTKEARGAAPKPIKRPGMSKAREIRLEQNRKSARESRKRKKAMMEDLQRSLVFFTKANAALRTEHEVLTRKMLAAHAELNKQGLPIPEVPKTEEAKPAAVPAPTSIPVVSTMVEPGSTMQGESRNPFDGSSACDIVLLY